MSARALLEGKLKARSYAPLGFTRERNSRRNRVFESASFNWEVKWSRMSAVFIFVCKEEVTLIGASEKTSA